VYANQNAHITSRKLKNRIIKKAILLGMIVASVILAATTRNSISGLCLLIPFLLLSVALGRNGDPAAHCK
jgi:hypothetical protein